MSQELNLLLFDLFEEMVGFLGCFFLLTGGLVLCKKYCKGILFVLIFWNYEVQRMKKRK